MKRPKLMEADEAMAVDKSDVPSSSEVSICEAASNALFCVGLALTKGTQSQNIEVYYKFVLVQCAGI